MKCSHRLVTADQAESLTLIFDQKEMRITNLLIVVLASASGLVPNDLNYGHISILLRNARALPAIRVLADSDDTVLAMDAEGNSRAHSHNLENFRLGFQNQCRSIMCLRGGVLGGREVKVKAVKKKHVASNPKPKEGDNTKADGLSRSQRRKAKEEAKVGRSSGKSGNAPAMSALDEAVEIAARATKSSRANPSLRTAFGRLDLLDDESGAFSLRQRHAAAVSSSSEVPYERNCICLITFLTVCLSPTAAKATKPMPSSQQRKIPTPDRLARHPRGRARQRRRATSVWRSC